MRKTQYIHYGDDHFDINKFNKIDDLEYIKPMGGLFASKMSGKHNWYNYITKHPYIIEKDFNRDFKEYISKSFRFTLKSNSKIMNVTTVKSAEILVEYAKARMKNILNCHNELASHLVTQPLNDKTYYAEIIYWYCRLLEANIYDCFFYNPEWVKWKEMKKEDQDMWRYFAEKTFFFPYDLLYRWGVDGIYISCGSVKALQDYFPTWICDTLLVFNPDIIEEVKT